MTEQLTADSFAVSLGRGLFAIVDIADRDLVVHDRWYASHQGKTRYAYRRPVGERFEFMHRVLLGLTTHDGKQADHINGNGLDNRRANLRLSTKAENGRNRGPNRNNTSGYKRVCWHKGCKKWLANIEVDRKTINLGVYDDPIDAALAYDLAAIEHHGEFAWTNFLKCPTREAAADRWERAS